MIKITEANSVVRLYHFDCFHIRGLALTSGRLAIFPDVSTSKRPNFLSSKFIDALGRSGRLGRLYRNCCIGGKYTCVFTYIDSYGNTSGRPKRSGIVFSVSVMQTNQRVGLSPDRIADALCIENKEDSDERH